MEEDEEGAELEGEKENEGVLNEDGTAGAAPKKKRKRSDGGGDDGASSPAKSKKKKKGKLLSEGLSECKTPTVEMTSTAANKYNELIKKPRVYVYKFPTRPFFF